MSSLVRRIVDRLVGAGRASPGGAALGAFGKHPGWDDHIDIPGLDTERLVALKRLLYVRGIGANVDAGAWDQLAADARLPGYHHWIVWQRGAELVLGRMWSSADRKGRSHYPMAVCADCSGLPLAWTLGRVPPILVEVEDRCVAAHSAHDVRAALDGCRRTLRQGAAEAGRVAAFHLPEEALRRLAECEEMGPGAQGMYRFLYHAERSIRMPGGAAPAPADRVPGGAAVHLRVPRCGSTWAERVRLWLGAVRRLVADDVPVLLLEPLREPWLDILVGEPGPPEFVCLRATPAAIPLTTAIPYTMDDAFRERAAGILSGDVVPARGGAEGPPRGSRGPAAPGRGPMAALRRWLAVAGVGRRRLVVLLLVLAALLVLGVLAGWLVARFRGGERPPASPDPAPAAGAARATTRGSAVPADGRRDAPAGGAFFCRRVWRRVDGNGGYRPAFREGFQGRFGMGLGRPVRVFRLTGRVGGRSTERAKTAHVAPFLGI